MNPKKTQEIEDIRSLRRAVTKKELAAYYNVSEKTFSKWMKEAEISKRGKLTPEDIKKIIEVVGHDRKAMRTMEELSNYYDVHRNTISAWLQRAGIEIKRGQLKPSETNLILNHLGRW